MPEVFLPCLTGQMLADVVQSKGATAGSLDGWGWRELKVLPVSWYDGLARILPRWRILVFGLMGCWMLTMPGFPKLVVMLLLSVNDLLVSSQLFIVSGLSARMGQLESWFKSWVPDSVFSAGSGRGSVEAWYTSSLDIEEVLAGAADSHVHLFCC